MERSIFGRTMKIMHFIHGLNTGGAETLVKNYMLNFDRQKNECVLLCINHHPESPYEVQLKEKGVRMIFVEDDLLYRKSDNIISRLINRYAKYFIIRKYIKSESPDILHGHLNVNRFIKFARPDKKTHIFYTVHSDPNKLWSENNKKELDAIKWLVRQYNMDFVALHDRMKKEIDELFGTNAKILNNGIDLCSYKNVKKEDVVRKELKIPTDALVVGHVGRFNFVKNHEFLVEVFKKIKNPRKFLLMVGDGSEKTRIARILDECGFEDRFLILSNCADVPNVLMAVDVFVLPSLYEGMPISLIEAQASGLPCFVSDAVTDEATISNLVTRLSLNEGAEKWAEVIDCYKKPHRIIINDEEWDISGITKKLELMYANAMKGEAK